MKNIKYIFTIALVSILLGCNIESDCLSPNNDCNCAEGFEGNSCKTKVTSKFIGTYIPEILNSASIPSNMTLIDSINPVKNVYFKNFIYNIDIRINFYGIADGEHILVPKQELTNASGLTHIEGDVCLIKANSVESLVMKLTLYARTTTNRRVVYFKK